MDGLEFLLALAHELLARHPAAMSRNQHVFPVLASVGHDEILQDLPGELDGLCQPPDVLRRVDFCIGRIRDDVLDVDVAFLEACRLSGNGFR